MALGTISKVADEFGYVLPWRDPLWVHHGGRDYFDPTRCQDRTALTRQQRLQQVGWAYGYFALSRRLYTVSSRRLDVAPTLVWMEGERSNCLIEYALSCGPYVRRHSGTLSHATAP